MLQLIYTICTYITATRLIAIAAVIGVIFGLIEIHKSIRISSFHADASIIPDFNKWTWEYQNNPTFSHAARVLNVSEIFVKSVKSGIYSYEAYKSSMLPVTFQYFYYLERAWHNEKKGTVEEFKRQCAIFTEIQLPIFKIYDRMIEEKVGKSNRSYKGLERFDPSKIDLSKSESKNLKREIKTPLFMRLFN